MVHHIIIGAGAAGLSCAKAIRQRDTTANITLIGREEQYPYDRPALSGYIAKGGTFDSIIMEKPEFYEESRLSLLYGTAAIAIDIQEKKVLLSNGDSLTYDKLCFATGASPFNPYQQGDGAVPVYTLRSYEDACAIADHLAGMDVFIVGGGILGLEAAMALQARGARVSIADKSPHLLSLQGDAYAGQRIREAFEALGIRVYLNNSVKTLLTDGVMLEDGQSVPCHGMLAAIGVRCELTLAKSIGLDINRGILINEKCETSLEGIYACGDCAEYHGVPGGQWAIALMQGETAGAQMADDQAAVYQPEPPMLAFHAPGLSLLCGGQLHGKLLKHVTSEENGDYTHLAFKDGKLCGTLLIGQGQLQGQAIQMLNESAPLAKAMTLIM